jgi:hypothetical protein
MADMKIVITGEQMIGKSLIAEKMRNLLPEWMKVVPDSVKPITITVVTTNIDIAIPKAAHEGDSYVVIIAAAPNHVKG